MGQVRDIVSLVIVVRQRCPASSLVRGRCIVESVTGTLRMHASIMKVKVNRGGETGGMAKSAHLMSYNPETVIEAAVA